MDCRPLIVEHFQYDFLLSFIAHEFILYYITTIVFLCLYLYLDSVISKIYMWIICKA
jgi:hypothetical protein